METSFCMPIAYQNSIAWGVDHYFSVGDGEEAYIKDSGLEMRGYEESFSIVALKVLSYVTVIIPLIVLIAKIVVRYTLNCEVVRLASPTVGDRITPQVLQKVERAWQRFADNNFEPCRDSPFTFLSKANQNFVFRHQEIPGIIFKCSKLGGLASRNAKTARRLARVELIKGVCEQKGFDRLLIPEYKKIEVSEGDHGNVVMIAEEEVDVNPSIPYQRESYVRNGIGSDAYPEPLRQLFEVICLTQLGDVILKNFPIVREGERDVHRWRIALLDLEFTNLEVDVTLRAYLANFVGTMEHVHEFYQMYLEAKDANGEPVMNPHLRMNVDMQVQCMPEELLKELKVYQFHTEQGITDANIRRPITPVTEAQLASLPMTDQAKMKQLIAKLNDMLVHVELGECSTIRRGLYLRKGEYIESAEKTCELLQQLVEWGRIATFNGKFSYSGITVCA